jgi:hypothetical protein
MLSFTISSEIPPLFGWLNPAPARCWLRHWFRTWKIHAHFWQRNFQSEGATNRAGFAPQLPVTPVFALDADGPDPFTRICNKCRSDPAGNRVQPSRTQQSSTCASCLDSRQLASISGLKLGMQKEYNRTIQFRLDFRSFPVFALHEQHPR